MIKIAILISGRGSNMVSLVNAVERKNLDCQVACVIANKRDPLRSPAIGTNKDLYKYE